MFISAQEAREAEQEARKQRLSIARRLLHADESKSPSSADILRIRRVVAAVGENRAAFDAMLAESSTASLFEVGALFYGHPKD